MRRGDYTGRLIFVYWVPAALWAAVVLAASSDRFSSQHSGEWIGEIVFRLIRHPLPQPQADTLNFLIRKAAHLTEYGILGALCFRAVRGNRLGWRARWAWTAVALAASVAVADEWHQFFVPSRTSSGWDVLLDAAGATVAQWVARYRGRAVSG